MEDNICEGINKKDHANRQHIFYLYKSLTELWAKLMYCMQLKMFLTQISSRQPCHANMKKKVNRWLTIFFPLLLAKKSKTAALVILITLLPIQTIEDCSKTNNKMMEAYSISPFTVSFLINYKKQDNQLQTT